MRKDCYEMNLQLTLERHFENLAQCDPDVRRLHSLWELLRTDLTDRLMNSKSVFMHYSLHDSTHSRTVISAIEMFLGEERIQELSATDTFMLLCCAYSHDYGMALTLDKVYGVLGQKEFRDHVEQEHKNRSSDNIEMIDLLYRLMEHQRGDMELEDIYLAIIVIVEEYLRPRHWEGVEEIEADFKGLFAGRIKVRLVKSIMQICQMHCAGIEEVFQLERYAQGAVTDIYHPRFVAYMLRLGDLLDLDNNRFPKWFMDDVARHDSKIPELSKMHYLKHEAITHLYIGPKRIQVIASCAGDLAVPVAHLIDDWLTMLNDECEYITKKWMEIAQIDFGRPPQLDKREIYIQSVPGTPKELYQASNYRLQMKMPQEKVLKLLEGTNIYSDRYVGIRELIQNAVDASLLQMWYDITHNKYAYLIQKNEVGEPSKLTPFDIPREIFRFYEITVELIRDLDAHEIFVVVKDKGIGIGRKDLEFMANIGESKEKNDRIQTIIRTMPNWMQPSGIFGIGLQSVFQITDQIEFYSRRPNQPEKKIVFYSFGKNQGRIETQELPPPEEHVFYDNCMQGTNVKFAVNRDKLWENRKDFLHYDPEFDADDPYNATFVELSHVISRKLRENPFEYFKVKFQTMTLSKKKEDKQNPYHPMFSFFNPYWDKEKKARIRQFSMLPFYNEWGDGKKDKDEREYLVIDRDTRAIYCYDSKDSIYYHLEIYPCGFKEAEDGQVGRRKVFSLARIKRNPIRVWYKFNEIKYIDAVFPKTMCYQDKSSFTALCSMDVIILDYPADQYLNIDRDHLKVQEKLTPDRLKRIQQMMFGRLYHRLVEENEEARKYLNAFLTPKEEGMAVSLLLLFYQHVGGQSHKRFLEKVKNRIHLEEERWALKIGDALLPLEYLKQREDDRFVVKHRAAFTLPEFWMARAGAGVPASSLPGTWGQEDLSVYARVDALKEFTPMEDFRIHEIKAFKEDGKPYLRYRISLRHMTGQDGCGKEEGPPTLRREDAVIEMDEKARLMDYCLTYDLHPGKDIFRYESIMKKLLKPDSEYPDLVVRRKPKSFAMGNNFVNALERGIDTFILSPFDDDTANLLKRHIKEGKYTADELSHAVSLTPHFRKCVEYVRKFHFSLPLSENQQHGFGRETAEKGRPRTDEKPVVDAYRKFTRRFCEALRRYAEDIVSMGTHEVQEKPGAPSADTNQPS